MHPREVRQRRFSTLHVLVVIAGVSAATSAVAAAPAPAPDGLVFGGTLSLLTVAEHLDLDKGSPLNPSNENIQAPHDLLTSELRPNLKITARNVQLIARPRVHYTYGLVQVDQHERDASSATTSYLSEAFGQWTVSESLSFSYGLQSYQWGSAEALSPSNRIFHETAVQRNILYEVRGHNLARLNFSAGKSFSTVVMAEVKDNPEDKTTFVADEVWQPKVLIKSEYNWNEGADYFGIVAGAYQHGLPWVGEYFSSGLPFFDGLSVFADISHQWGSDAWYPEANTVATRLGPQQQTTFVQAFQNSRKAFTLAAAGLKYDFINGVIIRGEYIFNEAGYTRRQFQAATAAVASRNPLQLAVLGDNVRRFLGSGLDLPGQRYGYVSVHVPDFLTIRDLMFDARTFYALADHSSLSYASLDYKAGDHGTVSLASAGSTGPKDGELRGYAKSVEYLSYRHDW